MTGPALELSGLKKSFGALTVTDDVSFTLPRGARYALIGPNGAGKTTLVGLLSGVVRLDSGRILLMGKDVTHERPERRVRRGLVRTFQVNSLFRGLTVLENIFLAASEHARASRRAFVPAAWQKAELAQAEAVAADLGLGDDLHTKVSELAYGRQRLVEIALALCLSPKVLLLDEPAAGVPHGDVSVVLDAIERLPSDIAILMIEHDMQVVRRFASTIIVLVNGRVLLSGTPGEVMASEEVRTVYLGQSGHARFAALTPGA